MSALSIDFTQLTANGSTNSVNVPVSATYAFYAYGTFGGGTVTFEASLDAANWFSLSTLTANGRASHALSSGEYVRVTLAGATAPTIDSGIR